MKQVMVIRSDLELGKGKLAVQVAHASLGSALLAKSKKSLWFTKWTLSGQKKVVVKVKDTKELKDLYQKAKRAKLPTVLIQDAGLTQLTPGTITCLGIGPAPDEELDKLTGDLKLV